VGPGMTARCGICWLGRRFAEFLGGVGGRIRSADVSKHCVK
jgi:hypothetical protein